MQGSSTKIIDIAMKYGYTSPDAFTHAFVKMHSVTPKTARTLEVKLKAYPHITFHISVNGDGELEYRIEEKQEINLVGMVSNVWV